MAQGTQLEFFAIPSPCIGVCQSGPKGFCLGCYRSRDERLYWLQVDDLTKRKIIAACHRRKRRAQQAAHSHGQASFEPGTPEQCQLFADDQGNTSSD